MSSSCGVSSPANSSSCRSVSRPTGLAEDPQWTIWSPRPGSRAIVQTILGLVRRWQWLKADFLRDADLLSRSEQEIVAEKVKQLTELDVLNLSGPGVFTRGVLDVVHADTGLNRTGISGLNRPQLFGSTLILPATFWEPGVAHSGSRGVDDPEACVWHHCARRSSPRR